MTSCCAAIELSTDGLRDCSIKLGRSRNSTSATIVLAALREWRTSRMILSTMLERLSGSLMGPMPMASRSVYLSFIPDASVTPSTRLSCQAGP